MEAVGRGSRLSATRFNCSLRVGRKANTATSPEGWEQVGSKRRAFVERLTSYQALQNGALLDRIVTHSALVDFHADWQPGRIVERTSDGCQWIVEAATGEGPQGRGGRQSYMSLQLSEKNPTTEF